MCLKQPANRAVLQPQYHLALVDKSRLFKSQSKATIRQADNNTRPAPSPINPQKARAAFFHAYDQLTPPEPTLPPPTPPSPEPGLHQLLEIIAFLTHLESLVAGLATRAALGEKDESGGGGKTKVVKRESGKKKARHRLMITLPSHLLGCK